jgi:hypothetical protein
MWLVKGEKSLPIEPIFSNKHYQGYHRGSNFLMEKKNKSITHFPKSNYWNQFSIQLNSEFYIKLIKCEKRWFDMWSLPLFSDAHCLPLIYIYMHYMFLLFAKLGRNSNTEPINSITELESFSILCTALYFL